MINSLLFVDYLPQSFFSKLIYSIKCNCLFVQNVIAGMFHLIYFLSFKGLYILAGQLGDFSS